MECELRQYCSLYKEMMSINGAHKHIGSKYCKQKAEDCARYIVYKKLGKDKIPDDLFPGEVERAFKIIKKFKRK